MSEKNEVIVVGAGPVGLSAALALAKEGASVRIIDRLIEPINQSRAAIVQARTLEHLERLGVVDDFLAEGVKVHGAAIYGPGHLLLVRPSLDHLPSPYPFMLGLEQFKTEALLTARLKEAGVEVERGIELVGFTELEDQVSVRLRKADGTETISEFAYVIGTDGAHSTVRAGLGLKLEGESIEATWVTADVKIRWDRQPDEAVAYLTEEGIVFIAAMNDDRWRVIVSLPSMTREQATQATVQEVQDVVSERFGANLSFYDPVWISAFGISARMSPTMNVGRVFMAGDAAHVHSPVGGQGMNTGIQDALNLAWKLSLVLRGIAKPELLESYNAERHANAKRLMSRVSRATKMANLRQPVAIEVRNQIIHVLGHLGMERIMPQMVSMLDVGYHQSPIVTEAHPSWLNRGPRAGERAPDAEGLIASGYSEPQRLFRLWSGDARHQLLVFGEAKEIRIPASPLYSLKHIVRKGAPAEGVVVDAEGHAYHVYEVHREGAFYLVRPDGIIAFRSGEPDPAALSKYIATWFQI